MSSSIQEVNEPPNNAKQKTILVNFINLIFISSRRKKRGEDGIHPPFRTL